MNAFHGLYRKTVSGSVLTVFFLVFLCINSALLFLDWPCFDTRWPFTWNYWRHNESKPTKERRRIQMLHDLANDDSAVALKWAAKEKKMEIQRKDVKNLLFSRRLLQLKISSSPMPHHLQECIKWFFFKSAVISIKQLTSKKIQTFLRCHRLKEAAVTLAVECNHFEHLL